jgi:hypothetical protein
MAVKLGLDAKLYRNTGTYPVSVWNELQNVVSLKMTLLAADGHKDEEATPVIQEILVEFGMLWDTADDDFVVIRDAFLNRAAIEFAVLDGPVNVSGSQGPVAKFRVVQLTRNEDLARVITLGVKLKLENPLFTPALWYVAH